MRRVCPPCPCEFRQPRCHSGHARRRGDPLRASPHLAPRRRPVALCFTREETDLRNVVDEIGVQEIRVARRTLRLSVLQMT